MPYRSSLSLEFHALFCMMFLEADIQNSLDQIFPMPPEELPEAKKAQVTCFVHPSRRRPETCANTAELLPG